MLQAAEKRFDVDRDAHRCRSLRPHLPRVAHSPARRRAEAVGLVGENAVADYERYLEAFVGAFANRHVCLSRIFFERI